MLKAYKYRIYPNNEQRIQIAKTFGCCRFVYNLYNMYSAYQNFFREHAGYPKFKSKQDNHKSYTINYTKNQKNQKKLKKVVDIMLQW